MINLKKLLPEDHRDHESNPHLARSSSIGESAAIKWKKPSINNMSLI